MNTFFDLKEFLITLLKKARLSLVIIFVCTLLGGLIRLIPLMKEYLTYDERVAAATTVDSVEDYPYLYEARQTLYIEPNYEVYGSSVVNTSAKVIEAFNECYQNKEILQPLVDDYFEEASALYYKNIEEQIKYQGILRQNVRRVGEILCDELFVRKDAEGNISLVKESEKPPSAESLKKIDIYIR